MSLTRTHADRRGITTIHVDSRPTARLHNANGFVWSLSKIPGASQADWHQVVSLTPLAPWATQQPSVQKSLPAAEALSLLAEIPVVEHEDTPNKEEDR